MKFVVFCLRFKIKFRQLPNSLIFLSDRAGDEDKSIDLAQSPAGSVEDLSIDESASKASRAREPEQMEEYVNTQGVRFMPLQQRAPYGALCVRELFRFLVSLCSPLDKQNNEIMTHLGLSLLQVALEIAADAVANFSSLLALVKDELCRNLILVRKKIECLFVIVIFETSRSFNERTFRKDVKNYSYISCLYVR